jgi:hypothetical protein
MRISSAIAYLLTGIIALISCRELQADNFITANPSNQDWQISPNGQEAVYVGPATAGNISVVLNRAALLNQKIQMELKSDADNYTFSSGKTTCVLKAESNDDIFNLDPGGALSLPNMKLNGFDLESKQMDPWVIILERNSSSTVTLTLRRATYAIIEFSVVNSSSTVNSSPSVSAPDVAVASPLTTNTPDGLPVQDISYKIPIQNFTSAPRLQAEGLIPADLQDQAWKISTDGTQAVYTGNAHAGPPSLIVSRSILANQKIQVTINSNADDYILSSGVTSCSFDSESTSDVLSFDPGGKLSLPDLELNGQELTAKRGRWVALCLRENASTLSITLKDATYATIQFAGITQNIPALSPMTSMSAVVSDANQLPLLAIKQNMPIVSFAGVAGLVDQNVEHIVPAHVVTYQIQTGVSTIPQNFEGTLVWQQQSEFNVGAGTLYYPDFTTVIYTIPDTTVYGDPDVVCRSMVNLVRQEAVTNINNKDGFNLLCLGEEHMINAVEDLTNVQLNTIGKYGRIILLNNNIPPGTPIIGVGETLGMIEDKNSNVLGTVVLPAESDTPILISNPIVADKQSSGTVVFGGLYAGKFTPTYEKISLPNGVHNIAVFQNGFILIKHYFQGQ